MSRPTPPKIALLPDPRPDWLAEAVIDGGGELTDVAECDAIVWADASDPHGLAEAVGAAPGARWVQLPFAGIENFLPALEPGRTWTCAKGVYGEPVAELALSLALAGLRRLDRYAAETAWSPPMGTNLLDARVTILGAGGIASALIAMLAPFDCHITVVRSHADHLDGADVVLDADRYHDALPGADLVVLALPLTEVTEAMIGRDELRLMEPHAWLINVARGRHVVTADLVEALRDGTIGGAGLDVTDPEPLPAGHPLWSLPNCIITPHTATTPAMSKPLLAARVTDNVSRFGHDRPLVGLVDLDAGY